MEQMQNHPQSGLPLSFDNAQATHLCTYLYTRTRGQAHAHTHSSLCKVLLIVHKVLNFKKPRKYWLKSSTYHFIRHARPFHGFRYGCGYLQMTDHHWPGSPGTQGWTVQGGAGGPSLRKETFSHP